MGIEYSSLTDASYWDRHWDAAGRTGRRGRKLFDDYADALLMRTYASLGIPAGAPVIELGSAPGHHLVELRQAFQWDVYGAEYAPLGVAQQRAVFAAASIPEDRVIQADIFAPEFQEQWRGKFDLVLSRGFIEHFDDPIPSIRAHVALAKPGGYVWILIPNYRGANWLLKRIFASHNLAAHNLSIMRRRAFASLFDGLGLETVACDYFGSIHLGMSSPLPGRLRRLYRVATASQALLNATLRTICPRRGPESACLSPYLVYVGRVTGSPASR